jgi:D-arabinose 1-dehydrogenase-like Zn-dependent alcohol dehydrogenase
LFFFLQFLPFDIVSGEKSIVGSMIGGTVSMKEMLEFSAKHKCFPQVRSPRCPCGLWVESGLVYAVRGLQVEVIDFDRANYGFDRIKEGSARYRMVLKIEGFRERKAAEKAAKTA